MTSLIAVFLLPFQGLGMLFRRGLRRYVFAPLFINILIFSLTAWIGSIYFQEFIDWVLPADSWMSYLEWLLWPLFALTYLVIAFYTFTMVANLIASPFNSILAAQVEKQITGQLPEDHSGSLMAEIIPAISGELGKIWYFLLLAIPVLILMIIPCLNAIGSVLWLLLGFWFLSIEYVDYPMGNHHLRPREQRQRLRKRPFQTWAFGAGANLLMMIPVINFAAMPASVAGATLWWTKMDTAQ
ncbi:sulfate transporter CysZ [Thiolapillus sp.]|uniref:sulfate transporter CysZ n=1 Tax=Thiolapillus sp. TaxID=2017437 RepID=UPI003AF857DD